ncbi:hypothetical protein [Paenibacillus antarcticus]|uniref:Uncharacterized protein n=1 Tax=Paenibacillus antarcticus TaxID=253703 RepID=A0A168PKU5_9BACL|nr:hypothetical protein [Paenibacillus antarcticus]OAB46862.1 hypothetical protein PBAT_09365 [Paenibacillus antarcticus]
MFKKLPGLCVIIILLGLQIACSTELKGNENPSANTKTEVIINKSMKSIPYKQLVYTKYSSRFTWESSNVEDLPKEIIKNYEDYKNSVPGGFIVKETQTTYYICVSIGKKESVTEGFKIKSLRLPDVYTEDDPTLTIEVIPVSNENNSDKEMKGQVSVRALISVSKEDLPDGVIINAISMSLED